MYMDILVPSSYQVMNLMQRVLNHCQVNISWWILCMKLKFSLSTLWCYLGKSVWSQKHDIQSSIWLKCSFGEVHTLCWKLHLDRTSGSKHRAVKGFSKQFKTKELITFSGYLTINVPDFPLIPLDHNTNSHKSIFFFCVCVCVCFQYHKNSLSFLSEASIMQLYHINLSKFVNIYYF